MSEFQTTSELREARSHHMNSLNRLREASKDWDDKTILRGEATMTNLMQQIYAIDAELSMAKQPEQAWDGMKSYLVYGPQGCGKTRNAPAIAKALGLNQIHDNWKPGDDRQLRDTLYLTNSTGPYAPFDRRLLSYDEAMKLVRQRGAA